MWVRHSRSAQAPCSASISSQLTPNRVIDLIHSDPYRFENSADGFVGVAQSPEDVQQTDGPSFRPLRCSRENLLGPLRESQINRVQFRCASRCGQNLPQLRCGVGGEELSAAGVGSASKPMLRSPASVGIARVQSR